MKEVLIELRAMKIYTSIGEPPEGLTFEETELAIEACLAQAKREVYEQMDAE